ncbi:MAG: hypothetical protein QM747_04200 [Nocardioides sp.]
MASWRSKLGAFLQRWRNLRRERRRIDDALADQRMADELDRAPANRFPPGHV